MIAMPQGQFTPKDEHRSSMADHVYIVSDHTWDMSMTDVVGVYDNEREALLTARARHSQVFVWPVGKSALIPYRYEARISGPGGSEVETRELPEEERSWGFVLREVRWREFPDPSKPYGSEHKWVRLPVSVTAIGRTEEEALANTRDEFDRLVASGARMSL